MLKLCTQCHRVHPADHEECPHCSTESSPKTPSRTSAALAAGVALLGLSFAGCDDLGGEAVALYGVPVEDFDGDGYDSLQDCDDGDEMINPAAEEIAGDGIDSNCDGEDDT